MRRSQRCVAQAVENCVQRWVAGRAAPEQVQLDRLGSSVTPAMPSRLEDAGTKAMPRPPATNHSIVRTWLTVWTTFSLMIGNSLTTRS